jgi:hypothetical protein
MERYIDALYRRRLQDMLGIEDMLRGIVTALKQTGQLDNTYIFLGSDNGFHLGQHRLPPGKETAFDEDIKVPLVVRGPGVPHGKMVEQFAMNDDMAPTFAGIAHASTPAFVDGRSLLPLLGSTPNPTVWRQVALVEHHGVPTSSQGSSTSRAATPNPSSVYAPNSTRAPTEPDNDAGYNRAGISAEPGAGGPLDKQLAVDVPTYNALRTNRYLYVEYADGSTELYDTAHDRYEMKNIATTAPLSLKSMLATQLHQLDHCAGQPCRNIENHPAPS